MMTLERPAFLSHPKMSRQFKSPFVTALVVLLSIPFSYSKSQLLQSLGIKGGLIAANQDWGYSYGFVPVSGLTRWGLDAAISLESGQIYNLSIVTEAHYIQKGFREQLVVNSIPGQPIGVRTVTPRLDYLSLPLLVKLHCNLGTLTLYGILGPRLDVLLAANSAGFTAVIDHIKATDYGWSFGIGVETSKILSCSVGLELRYSPSYQNIYSTNLLTVKNRSIESLVCFAF